MTKQIYKIQDVWLLLKILRAVIFFGILVYIGCIIALYLFADKKDYFVEFSIAYIVLFCIYFILVFITFNKGYIVDLIKEDFSFPATDVENSLIGILTFKKYRDFAQRKHIALKDISDIYIDTQKTQVFSMTTNKTSKKIYTINIVGFHGSNNLNFSSRQKRDEVRGILVQAAKDVKIGIRDRKVAEFG